MNRKIQRRNAALITFEFYESESESQFIIYATRLRCFSARSLFKISNSTWMIQKVSYMALVGDLL